MSYIRTNRPSTGGGGGQTLLWARDTLTRATNFTSGEIVVTLTQTPVDADGIQAFYNGVKINAANMGLSGNNLTMNFADPYVTTYDDPSFFEIQYPYATT